MDYKIKLKNISQSAQIVRLPDNAQGFVLTKILENFSNQNCLVIAENDAQMENFLAQINFFNAEISEKFEVLNFPAWDCLPFDRTSPKPAISSARIRCLYKIANQNSAKKFLILTTVNAVLQKVVNKAELKNYGLKISPKSRIKIEEVCSFLVTNGYVRSPSANTAGEFAVRGGIVDFVTEKAADLIGYRVDFFGDEVESIKAFDVLTQMSQEELKEIEILPASEVVLNEKTVKNFRQKYRENFLPSLDDQLYSSISENRSYPGMEHWLPFFYEENLVSFFDYFSNCLGAETIFLNQKIFQQAALREKLVAEYFQARVEAPKQENFYHPISPQLLYLSADELAQKAGSYEVISFNNFDASDLNQRIFDLEIKPIPDFFLSARSSKGNAFQIFKEFLPKNSDKKIVISCFSDGSRSQINRILHDYEISSVAVENFDKISALPKNFVALVNLPLNHGFETSDLIFISEQDLLGEKIIRRKTSNKAASQRLLEEGLAINLGELVTHRDHGIGRFEGSHLVSAGGVKTEMLKIAYGGSDTLFVPVDDITLLTRYGSDNPLIQLDRLGVAGWKNRCEKVKKKIQIAAEELLKIAAARKLKKAPILVPEQHFYDEFKARFAFVETEDQLKAIAEVEEDLQRGSPMDRLICGDVGFGKTEVALRAAALVVSGKEVVSGQWSVVSKTEDESLTTYHLPLTTNFQIALVAPTTLLVRQHFKNFSKRFEGTGVKIAQLSRLISASEAKKVRADIESGDVDIVIGTHALLQKNIKFKNLALVIIDEEQHFGVAQKERLKELRNEVHVLTLSATPIPRTLQMSLSGVKDLSLIATPPVDRIAVRNFVMPYDSVIVREAVLREFNRSGRVFFVVPRIRDIEEMEPRLKTLLPEIKIRHAHGQMSPTQLDEIMNDFVDGKIDMLLSTTIIESGIDISQANTMIIYRAEMFGLSQLYQLRGRVGRGKTRAYAYFMLSPKKLSPESQKKLEVMQNLDSLGVGFTIASHDMDIRGSGNLLGDEQSGHVNEVGVELYQQMLVEAIAQQSQSVVDSRQSIVHPSLASLPTTDYQLPTTVKLGISLLIPEPYMPDLSLRMSFYKKIAGCFDEKNQAALIDEMTDRFGKLPQEVLNLLEVARLKHRCKTIGIDRLEANSQGILIGFHDNKFAAPEALMKMIFASKDQIKLSAGQKVLFVGSAKNDDEKFSLAFNVVAKLQSLIT